VSAAIRPPAFPEPSEGGTFIRKRCFLNLYLAGVIFLLSPAAALAENVILRWDRVLGQTLQAGEHPGHILPARSFAMLHLAMFDAANSVDGAYIPYLIDVPGGRNASVDAAAAYAAHGVLAGLYPGRKAVLDQELAESLAGIPMHRRFQFRRIGSIVAGAMLNNRANDGWDTPWTPYSLDPLPGNWQGPTPFPGFAVFTNVMGVTPFAMSSGIQFLPRTPPELSSAEYAASLNNVKERGSLTSSTRTADQTLTALLWANPPVSDAKMMGVVASTSVEQGLTTLERSRLFALAIMAFHDALQTTFTSQYTYGRWRPLTAIQRADEDDNPATTADPGWASLLPPEATPPHPSYASNASSASASITKILSLFYETDDMPFQIDHGPGLGGVRGYPSFTSLANEVANSRIYGGAHFQYETAAGQQAGRDVAMYVFYTRLRPRGPCRPGTGTAEQGERNIEKRFGEIR